MNSTLVLTAAVTTGLLIFVMLRKKQIAEGKKIYNKINKHDKHKLTHAFAKAKKQAMS